MGEDCGAGSCFRGGFEEWKALQWRAIAGHFWCPARRGGCAAGRGLLMCGWRQRWPRAGGSGRAGRSHRQGRGRSGYCSTQLSLDFCFSVAWSRCNKNPRYLSHFFSDAGLSTWNNPPAMRHTKIFPGANGAKKNFVGTPQARNWGHFPPKNSSRRQWCIKKFFQDAPSTELSESSTKKFFQTPMVHRKIFFGRPKKFSGVLKH